MCGGPEWSPGNDSQLSIQILHQLPARPENGFRGTLNNIIVSLSQLYRFIVRSKIGGITQSSALQRSQNLYERLKLLHYSKSNINTKIDLIWGEIARHLISFNSLSPVFIATFSHEENGIRWSIIKVIISHFLPL